MNPTCPKCGGPVEPGKDCPRCLLQVAMGESALTPSPGGTARPGLPVPSAGMGDTVKSPPPSSVPFAVPIDSEAVPPIPLGAPSAAVTPTVKSPTPGRTGSERPAPPSHGATHDAAPPARLRGLEILESLGRGGMGQVYKARQVELDRIVAVKVLPAKLAEDPEFVQRFKREAKALAALDHPNIVRVFDCGAEDDHTYLVMEFIDGPNLRDLMRKGLTPEQALALVPPICEALEYAHGEGVVHRDIKPENILVDRRGRVKIADFGLAKIIRADAPNLTQSREVMGTPHYMAPEQFERPKEVDHRADIYALGVVVYEMLTGELPIGRFQPPSQRVQVDVRLDEVVLKALEKDPGRRYQRASEMQSEVTRVGTPLPGEAAPSGPGAQAEPGRAARVAPPPVPPLPSGRIPPIPPVPPVGAFPTAGSLPSPAALPCPQTQRAVGWATASLGTIAVAAVVMLLLANSMGDWIGLFAMPVLALLAFSLLDASFRRTVNVHVRNGLARVVPGTFLEPVVPALDAGLQDPSAAPLRAAIPMLAVGAFMFVFAWGMSVMGEGGTLWAFELLGLALFLGGGVCLLLHVPFRAYSVGHPASWVLLPGIVALLILIGESVPGPRFVSSGLSSGLVSVCAILAIVAGATRVRSQKRLALAAILLGFVALVSGAQMARRRLTPPGLPGAPGLSSFDEPGEADIGWSKAHLVTVTFEPRVAHMNSRWMSAESQATLDRTGMAAFDPTITQPMLQFALSTIEDRALILLALRDLRGGGGGIASAEDQCLGDIMGNLDAEILTGSDRAQVDIGLDSIVTFEPYTIGFFLQELRDYPQYWTGKIPYPALGRKIVDLARRKWEGEGLRIRSVVLYELRRRREYEYEPEPVWERQYSETELRVADLKRRIETARRELLDLQGTYTDDHPRVVNAQKVLDGFQRQMEALQAGSEAPADSLSALVSADPAARANATRDLIRQWPKGRAALASAAKGEDEDVAEAATGILSDYDLMDHLARWGPESVAYWRVVWDLRPISSAQFRLLFQTAAGDPEAVEAVEKRLATAQRVLDEYLMPSALNSPRENETARQSALAKQIQQAGAAAIPGLLAILDVEADDFSAFVESERLVKALRALGWLKRQETLEFAARHLRNRNVEVRQAAEGVVVAITGKKPEDGVLQDLGLKEDMLWWGLHRDDYVVRWREEFRAEEEGKDE